VADLFLKVGVVDMGGGGGELLVVEQLLLLGCQDGAD